MSTCKMIALSLGLALMLTAGCSQPTPSPAPPETATETPAPSTVPAARTGLPLVENGASAYSIVLELGASPSERQAAQDIQAYVQACTGVVLPIVEGKPEGGGPMLVLGNGAIAQGLGVSPTSEQLGGQGYQIKTAAPHIVIAGTREAGTLYGAWDFLESEIGVRWYAPGVTQTPEQSAVRVAEQNRLVKPPFMWRLTSYEWPGGDAEFRSRQRENNGAGDAEHPWGVQYMHDGICHSYFWYISPDEFFDTHPEYFSEIGGKRIRTETQLCLTNPGVLEIVTERMLARMESRPEMQQHNFSQMDYYNYCECAECAAINREYGTNGGTQYWFLNKLADRTARVYPDKLIGTLAYMYTEEPPKNMTMHPNIAVWLCHMYPSCDSHSVRSCPLNADYRRRAEEWSKICNHLYIWHYVVNFAHYYCPFPNLRAVADDWRFYRDIGVEGVFAQGMGHGGGGGEFSLLRPYYLMRLMFNPDLDPEAVLADFLEGYYGAAADPIGRYIALLHDKVENENIHMHLYTNPAQGYLPDEIMERAAALFDEAEAAVQNDDELLERVKVARMPLSYARWFPRNGHRIEHGTMQFVQPLAPPEEMQEFVDRMARHGFNTIREWGGEPSQIPMYSAVLNMPLPVVTIQNEHLVVDVAPFLGGRAIRIVDRKSGRNVAAYNTVRNLMYPFCGGEETRIGGLFMAHMGGNMDPAVPKEVSETSLTLEAQTANGFVLERTLTLAPDRPALTVTAVATNPRDLTVEAQIRSHFDMDIGDVKQTRVSFTNRAGNQVAKDMSDIIAGFREGERYHEEDRPDGSWTFTGPDGVRVTQKFENADVDFTWLVVYPDDLNQIEVEVWGHKALLEQGQTASLVHMIEIDVP